MKFGQFFTAFGIAFFIFLGVFLGENMRYDTLSKVKNPFEKAIDLNTSIEVSNTEESQVIFTKSGEFWQVFPGTAIDITNDKRVLRKGEVFLSSDFISPTKDIKKEGQLMVGDLLINAPFSSILVTYAPAENIQIFAFNHSIELSWGDIRTPFLVPPGMMVSINEKLISPKTTTLFYSKLKKEFRLKPFHISLTDTEKSQTPEEKIAHSLAKLKKKEKDLINYVKIVPETWFSMRPDHLMGKIISNVKTNTFGLPRSKKEQFAFQKMIAPLAEGHFLVKENKKIPAQQNVNKFNQILDSYEWNILLKSNQSINKIWNDFFTAQYVWIKELRTTDTAYVFADLHKVENKNEFDKIDNEFSRFETLVAHKKVDEAESIIRNLKREIERMSIQKESQTKLTKRRRILKELLSSQNFLQTEDPFGLYVILIKKETALPLEDRAILDELTLEVAQELLFFLNQFIKESPDPGIVDILISGYNEIKSTIASSSERSGRESLFTKEEEEIQTLIKIAGSSKISTEDIENIKEEQAYEAEIQERIAQLQSHEEEVTSKPPIHDEETLKNFFDTLEVDTNKMEVVSLKNNEYLNFREGRYIGNFISGTFQAMGQVFKTIKINEQSSHYVQPKFLKGIINTLIEDTSSTVITTDESKSIPQNSNKAILEKSFIHELFSKNNLLMSRENIIVLNEALTIFEISEAVFEGKNKVDFIYNNETEEMSEITLSIENKKFRFTEKSYQRTAGIEEIRKKVEEVRKK